MKTAAAYIRVSTEDQTEFSPDAQRRAIEDYASRNDLTLPPAFIYADEGISGRKADKRPAFLKMIATAKEKPRPFDVILVHKLDRFARNREDSVVYKSLLRKECGISVVSITEHLEEDKFSIILESMLEAMAEYYSLNLSEEVKKGMMEKARRGQHIGPAPFGYLLKEGKLVPHPVEKNTLQLIFHLYANQQYTLSSLASFLNENHLFTKKQNQWTTTALSYLLQNPVYAGNTCYNRKQRNGKENPPEEWILKNHTHPPLISQELFLAVQNRLSFTKTLSAPVQRTKTLHSWCQHLCRCHHCGSVLQLRSTQKGAYYSFYCPKAYQGLCPATYSLSNRKCESLVLSQLKKELPCVPPIPFFATKNDPLRHSLSALAAQKQTALSLAKNSYLNGVDTLAEYETNKLLLEQEQRYLTEKLERQTTLPPKKYFSSPATLLEETDFSMEQKNKIAACFIKEITLDFLNHTLQIHYYATKTMQSTDPACRKLSGFQNRTAKL